MKAPVNKIRAIYMYETFTKYSYHSSLLSYVTKDAVNDTVFVPAFVDRTSINQLYLEK